MFPRKNPEAPKKERGYTHFRRDTWLIFSAYVIVSMVLVITFVFYPIYMKIRDIPISFSALFLSLEGIVTFAAFFIWGFLSDKLGKRRELVVVSNLGAGFTFFPLADADIAALIIIRSVQVFLISSWVLILEILTEPSHALNKNISEKKGRRAGKDVSQAYLATGIGGVLGGILFGFLGMDGAYNSYDGYRSLFYFCGTLCFLSSILMVPTSGVSNKSSTSIHFNPQEIFSHLASTRIRWLYVLVFLQWTGSAMMFTYFIMYIRTTLGAPDTLLGNVQALNAGLAVVFALVLKKHMGPNPMNALVFGSLCYIFMALSFIFIKDYLTLAIIFGIPLAYLILVPSTVIITEATSIEERGRGVGLLNSITRLGNFAGVGMGGVVLSVMGEDYILVFWTSLAFMVPAFILSFFSRKFMRYPAE